MRGPGPIRPRAGRAPRMMRPPMMTKPRPQGPSAASSSNKAPEAEPQVMAAPMQPPTAASNPFASPFGQVGR